MEFLASLRGNPAALSPEAVGAAVAKDAAGAMNDLARRTLLADGLMRLWPVHADTITRALPVPLVAQLLQDGRKELVAGVIERWTAQAAWDKVREFRAATAAGGAHATGFDLVPLHALVRAIAFIHPVDARRLLTSLPRTASPESDLPGAPSFEDLVAEAEALIFAVEDIPSAEGAARRALARAAAERAWRPDAWGPDQGALVSLVRKRSTSASDGFDGPLIKYLTWYARDEVARIAKRAGTRGGGGANDRGSWWTRGTVIPTAAPGTMGYPDADWDRPALLQALADEASMDQEQARLKAAAPPRARRANLVGRAGGAGTNGGKRDARGQRQGLGGITSGTWWFPIPVALLFAVLAISRPF